VVAVLPEKTAHGKHSKECICFAVVGAMLTNASAGKEAVAGPTLAASSPRQGCCP
jgi:hypothetical protein